MNYTFFSTQEHIFLSLEFFIIDLALAFNFDILGSIFYANLYN